VVEPAAGSESRSVRVLVAVGFVATVALDALYLAIIAGQGATPPSRFVVPFVASYFGAIALAMLASLFVPPVIRSGLRAASAAGLVLIGFLTALSIGLAVLIAGAICGACAAATIGSNRRATTIVSAVIGAVLAVAVLLVGLQLAWSPVTS
jgi:hypothetical protein